MPIYVEIIQLINQSWTETGVFLVTCAHKNSKHTLNIHYIF